MDTSCILTSIDLTLIAYLNDNKDYGKVKSDDNLALATGLWP